MHTRLHHGMFYEVCPRCGLSPVDYLSHRFRFPCCPVCRNGKYRPGAGNNHFYGGGNGPRF